MPTGFFKIVADLTDPDNPEVIAFLFPHRVVTGNANPLEGFLTSVDEIERVTRLDFLTALPQDVQDRIESQAATALW